MAQEIGDEVFSPAYCRHVVEQVSTGPITFLKAVEKYCTDPTPTQVRRSLKAWNIELRRPRKSR